MAVRLSKRQGLSFMRYGRVRRGLQMLALDGCPALLAWPSTRTLSCSGVSHSRDPL
jgi:hypothetical protein